MKAKIHPQWYKEAKVTCACGNSFTISSTSPTLQVEVCSACHPFYTGQMKYVDSAGRVEAFEQKRSKAAKKVLSKAERRRQKRLKKIMEEMSRPESLKEISKQK